MTTAPEKIACIHLMRTAGTFVNAYLAKELSGTHRIRVSWFEGLRRDWTDQEIRTFADDDSRQYVHNHVASWTNELLEHLKSAGFFTFAFVRDVGDQLCSLFALAHKRGAKLGGLTLDAFIQRQLDGESVCGIDASHWAIPTWWETLDFIQPFSDESFENFITDQLALPWNRTTAERAFRNQSSNPGYAEHRQRVDIKPATHDAVLNSEFHRRYELVTSR